MGHEESKTKFLGSRSRSSTLFNDYDIDYKDKKNTRRVKKELYDLFIADKLVHIDRADEEIKRLDELEYENKKIKIILQDLIAQLKIYKKNEGLTLPG